MKLNEDIEVRKRKNTVNKLNVVSADVTLRSHSFPPSTRDVVISYAPYVRLTQTTPQAPR